MNVKILKNLIVKNEDVLDVDKFSLNELSFKHLISKKGPDKSNASMKDTAIRNQDDLEISNYLYPHIQVENTNQNC